MELLGFIGYVCMVIALVLSIFIAAYHFHTYIHKKEYKKSYGFISLGFGFFNLIITFIILYLIHNAMIN